jgi:hypothetical protein
VSGRRSCDTCVDSPPPVVGRPILGSRVAPRPLPQRLTMVPQERQEARQVIGDGSLSVLRRRVQQEVRIQIRVVMAVGRNQERHAVLDAFPVQPPCGRMCGQALQRRPRRARHRQLSTGEVHPPTQDRHCLENYRGSYQELTSDTQHISRAPEKTYPAHRKNCPSQTRCVPSRTILDTLRRDLRLADPAELQAIEEASRVMRRARARRELRSLPLTVVTSTPDASP